MLNACATWVGTGRFARSLPPRVRGDLVRERLLRRLREGRAEARRDEADQAVLRADEPLLVATWDADGAGLRLER